MKNLPNKFVRKTIIFTLAIFLQATISYAEELTIKIGEVQEIPIDEIGILNQQNGGLRQDIWSGSDPTFIQNLLPTLPVETDSKTVQKLIKSVLLSSTTALVADDNQQTSMFNTRLKLLAKSGDAENIEKMLALVPQQKVNEEMYKIYTTAYFLAGNYKDACLKTNEYLKQYPELKKEYLNLTIISQKLCTLDINFPPFGLWVDYYNKSLNDIIIINTTIKRKGVIL
jgi:hypothetical protein